RTPVALVPHAPTLEHLRSLFARKPFGAYLGNSALVASAATLLGVAVAALAAGALARMGSREKRLVLLALVVAALVPPILLLLPIYEAVRALSLLNRPIALVVPYAALSLPLAIWILEAGFAAIPPAVEEAALLDGASPLRRLLAIRLPLAAPSLVTA